MIMFRILSLLIFTYEFFRISLLIVIYFAVKSTGCLIESVLNMYVNLKKIAILSVFGSLIHKHGMSFN